MVKVLLLASIIVMGLSNLSNAEICIASVHYGDPRTASGIKWINSQNVAAHKTLAFNRKVRVSANGKETIVRIIDRGPYVKGRCIDLSPVAAKEISCGGLCKVSVQH